MRFAVGGRIDDEVKACGVFVPWAEGHREAEPDVVCEPSYRPVGVAVKNPGSSVRVSDVPASHPKVIAAMTGVKKG